MLSLSQFGLTHHSSPSFSSFSVLFLPIPMATNDFSLDFDTIVIGAGIMGSACAYKIAQTGNRTLLLEQFSLDHKLGSSHGASRIIRLSHSQPHWIPLAQDAYREWDRLQQDCGEPLYIKNGLLTMDPNWAQTQQRAAVLSQFGVPHEVLRGGAAIEKRFPHLCNYGEEWSALYEPGGGTILAESCLRTIQKKFLELGNNLAQIRDKEQVLDIVPMDRADDDRTLEQHNHPAADGHQPTEYGPRFIVEVKTTKRKYLTGNVVIAAGAWLSRLVSDLPLRVQPHLVGIGFWRIKSHSELFRPDLNSPNLLTYEDGQELFALPETDFPGLVKFAVHLGLPLEGMDKRAEMNLPEWAHSLVAQHLAKHMPDLDHTTPALKSSCIYAMTDDLQFIIDRHPRHPRCVFIAGGFSGTGFKFGLTVGTVMAAWVKGQPCPAHIDVSPFRLDRTIADEMRPKL